MRWLSAVSKISLLWLRNASVHELRELAMDQLVGTVVGFLSFTSSTRRAVATLNLRLNLNYCVEELFKSAVPL
jgi:hypothetical protein